MKTMDDVYDRLKAEYNLSALNVGFVNPDLSMDEVYEAVKESLDKLMNNDFEEVFYDDAKSNNE